MLLSLSTIAFLFILFFVLSVHANSYWSVVQQLNFHVSAEFACGYCLSYRLRKLGAEGLVEWDRVLVRACSEPAGAIPFLIAGVERELTYYQCLALYIDD